MSRNKKKHNKIYMDAVKYFEDGYIDKAIAKCEEGISKSLKDTTVLNLKGLLLYLKGDLNGAITTWKINYDFNDDKIAKNYIKNAKEDKIKTQYYNNAEMYFKKYDFDNAINELEKCQQSDFNKIKVNLSLAACYLKKQDYAMSAAYLTKVLELDKNNKLALEVRNQLKKYGDIDLTINKSNKKAISTIACSVLVLILASVGITMYTKNKLNADKGIVEQPQEIVEDIKEEILKERENVIEVTEVGEDINVDEDVALVEEDINVVLVNVDELEVLIENKEYDKIINKIRKVDANKLQGKEKAVYSSVMSLLRSDDAIEYYYNKGLDLYKNKDYVNAYNELKIVYDYGKENYLLEHGIYFMGASKEENNEKLEAIKYYEEYYNTFKEGSYIEVVLYSLANLYKDEDLDKCRQYAEELKYDYSDSIYNNDNIFEILKQLN